MTEVDIVRIIAEIIGMLMALLVGFRWLVVRLLQIIRKLDGLTERLDTLNDAVAKHEAALSEQRDLNNWLAGKIGEPLPARREIL